jgi:hypothetical protein
LGLQELSHLLLVLQPHCLLLLLLRQVFLLYLITG